MAIANITNNILTDSGVTTSSLQPTITLTTTGTSGAATFSSNTLNIPNYGSALSGYVTLTTNQTISGVKTFSSMPILSAASGVNGQIVYADATNTLKTITNFKYDDATGVLTTQLGNLGSNAYTSTAYLPLTGGTLTGALGGTSAIFSSNVAVFCTPYNTTQYSLEVNGGLLIKNTGRTASLTIIDADPNAGGNDAFVQVKVGGTFTAAYSTIQTYYGASNVAGSLQLQPLGGNVLIGTTTNSSYNLDVSGSLRNTTSAYFATASGSVGIGTTSATYTLSFNGDVATTIGMNQGTLGTQVPLTLKGSDGPNGTNNEGGPIYISSGLGTGNGNTSNIIFSTAPSAGSGSTRQTLTERMRIRYDGEVLVGTTSNTINTTNFGIRLAPDGTLQNSRNAGAGGGVFFTYGNAGQMFVYGNGNVVNTNGSYGTVSDSKLKENIVDTTPKLDKLNKVRIVDYNLIEYPEQKLLGVIAQELEQIFPNLVDELIDKDEEGNDLETTTKSVKMSVFVPILIKAIQEQQAQIEELKVLIKNK